MQIGEKIRIIRESRKITTKEMADFLEMSVSNYHKIERNEIDINTDKTAKIAEKLEIEPYKLLMDEGLIVSITNNTIAQDGYVHNKYYDPKVIQLLEEKNALLLDKIKYLEEKIKFLER